MGSLSKATLRELAATEGGAPIGDPVSVQFNPTSLRVQLTNKSPGGQQSGSQARQRPGTGEMTVSFDLVFDTADEGTPDAPVSVMKKTELIEKYVRPRGNTPSLQTPPRVEFKWGTFLVEGVMESANTDLDHFASDGTPLRAKVAVSIKGQNPAYRYEAGKEGQPGASDTAAAPPGPHTPAAGAPGTTGGADTPAKIAQAMPGESLPQLAARNGLDPAAWRALAAGIGNPLNLGAGVEIALPATLNLRPGVTGQAGATLAPGPVDPVRQGQALMRQGGVRGAIDQDRGAAHSFAVGASRSAFGMAPVTTPVVAPPPYGAGVPLRDLRGDEGERLPVSPDPTVPRWQALPVRSAAALRALDSCHCSCAKRS